MKSHILQCFPIYKWFYWCIFAGFVIIIYIRVFGIYDSSMKMYACICIYIYLCVYAGLCV